MDKKLVDKNRRNFLKILALGGGVLMLGKIFGPKILDLFYGSSITKDFEKFKVTENKTWL